MPLWSPVLKWLIISKNSSYRESEPNSGTQLYITFHKNHTFHTQTQNRAHATCALERQQQVELQVCRENLSKNKQTNNTGTQPRMTPHVILDLLDAHTYMCSGVCTQIHTRKREKIKQKLAPKMVLGHNHCIP